MLQEVPLLERSEERGTLASAVRAAVNGSGQFVLVDGSTGLGKSTMLSVARTDAKAPEMVVLHARGTELERDFSFGIVHQLFDGILYTADRQRLKTLLGGAASGTRDALQPDVAEPWASVDGLPFRMLHGLYWFTANLCSEAPLLIAIDDAHNCDLPSLQFLAFLQERLQGLPLLVVASVRTGDPLRDETLWQAVAAHRLTRTIHLRPLSKDGSKLLVHRLRPELADDQFCERLFEATGGNPLLLHEVLRMADEGLLGTAEGAQRLLELAPMNVKRRVGLALSRLGTPATKVARIVAVLGDADPRIVTDLAGLKLSQVLQAAEGLTRAEFLSPSSSHLRFLHPLTQSAVYDAMPQSERQALHAAAARMLAEAGEPPERVAQHLLRCPPLDGDFEATNLRRAAAAAGRRGSPETAKKYLQRCLDTLVDPDQRAEVVAELARASFQVAPAEAIGLLRKALDCTADVQQRAKLSNLLAEALALSAEPAEVDEALEVWRTTIDSLNDSHRDLRQRIQVNYYNGLAGRPDTDIQTELEYRHLLREVEPTSGLGGRSLDCLLALISATSTGDLADAAARVERAMTVDLIEPDSFLAWTNGALALMQIDLRVAISHLDAGVAAAQQHGSVAAVGRTLIYRGLARLWRGELKDAEEDLRAARSAMELANDVNFWPNIAYLAEVLLEQGHLQEARSVLERVLAEEDVPNWGAWWWFARVRARLHIAQGRIQDGVDALLRCGEWAQPQGYTNPAFVPWRCDAALGLHLLSRSEEAGALMEEELGLVRHWGEPRTLGRALRVAGQVTTGDSGLGLLRESVDVLAPSSARLEYAKSLAEFGAALRRAGKRAEAREQLTRALEVAEQCGAQPLSDQARTDLHAAGGRPAQTYQTGPGALTVSERRVAELAAAGHSNREIAQRLFITTKTVEVHLSGTYRKLGIERRAQLAHHLISPTGSSIVGTP